MMACQRSSSRAGARAVSAIVDAVTWASGFPGVGHVPPICSAGFATFDDQPRERDVLRVFDEIALRDRAQRTLVFGSDLP